MSFDATSLADTMTDAASSIVDCWPAMRIVAESELRRYADTLGDVYRLYQAGAIEEDEAHGMAETYRTALAAVLRGTQSVSAPTARTNAPRLMKAAIHAARPIVNSTFGFRVL